MGKNTDKLFITHSEWSAGGHSASSGASGKPPGSVLAKTASQLPFWTCSISQQPISDGGGVCDAEGHVFDIRNVLPFIRKNGKNPVTGESLESKDLVKLKIEKNSEGKYIDPISFKEFQRLSEPVVILPSGRVYFEETVNEHNVKPKFWRDLVSDETFTKKDIVKLKGGVGILKQKEADESQKAIVKKRAIDESGADNYNKKTKLLQTSGRVGQSLTSTSIDPKTKSDFVDRPIESLLRQKKFLEPGYARIETNYGSLNVELDAKYSPKAVYNFVKLAQDGYYDGVVFHRNIKNFMIQGGDPSGTGEGGKSAFGKPFADETNTPLKHDARGVLSMANRGKNTNTSQFFITYRRAPHLDGKHTVFGRVVGGMQVLETLERVPVDASDRPMKSVKIETIKVLVDPFAQGLHGKDPQESQKIDPKDDTPWLKKGGPSAGSVGKYLSSSAAAASSKPSVASSIVASAADTKPRAKTSISKSSFSGW